MYVVTDEKGVILAISETLSYQENGNPLVNDGKLAIAESIVGGVYENVEVPSVVTAGNYTYIDGVFEPYVYEPEYPADIELEQLRTMKTDEMKTACDDAIYAGVDVTTTQGSEHFALQLVDQINLTTAYNAVLNGAEGYPYHADNTMCRMFTADEIKAVSEAGIAHITYHTTLCNHLLTWVRRAETIDELKGIKYKAEGLPSDLAQNMQSVLSSAQSL